MPTPTPIPIQSLPGIKRDSTQFEGDNYSDGLWCRFSARGLPTKMAGYKSVTAHLDEIVRGMDSFTIDASSYLHLGSRSKLNQIVVGLDGTLGTQTDRTPAGFVPNANNLWQIIAFYNKVTGMTNVVAHAGQNLSDIASSTESTIYYGPVDANTPLVATGLDLQSGGIVAVPPYVLSFGTGGRVDVSKDNDLTVPNPNSVFVTAQKIVAGLPLRNSSAPACVLWSLDRLVTGVFNASATATAGGFGVFDWNEVAEISLLSSQSVIEFDSIYYWAGVDRFMLFNGISRELLNNMNIDFFYDNVNFSQRQKVFAMKVPRWGEIWWCFPFGNATECNHAVIYNVRLNIWYDTPLPDGGRSAGIFAKVYQRPFMCDVDLTGTGYTLWQHETGVNKVVGTTRLPIQSYYTTHEISAITSSKPINKEYRVAIIEPDFVQAGDLTCSVLGRPNARATPTVVGEAIVPEVATGPETEVARVKSNGRLMSFRFESNTLDGNFKAGKVMAHIEETDGRFTS